VIARRALFLLGSVGVMFLGLASRRYREQLPTFLGEYSGDTLWALMLYLLVSCVIPDRSAVSRWLIAVLLATAVEISQLYHAPWIDSIRQTKLGGLVLGFGFLWTDLICYVVGITIGVLAECAFTTLVGGGRKSALR
jgi:hypothetical protein